MLYITIVAFMVPLVIMIFAYTRVGITLHKSVKKARSMIGSGWVRYYFYLKQMSETKNYNYK